jgi:phage-related protein
VERKRKLIFFRNYFSAFFEPLEEGVKEKIDYVLYLVVSAERIPKKFFRAIAGSDGLFEIRIEHKNNIYRIFCCFDEGNIIVLFNGFQKKPKKRQCGKFKKSEKDQRCILSFKKEERWATKNIISTT